MTDGSRPLIRIIPAQPVSDGAGVKILRSLGLTEQLRLDPFLMLDCFGSDQPADYLAGFPAHPHRGFETVTYMLDGHMLHQDHLGNIGHLKSGGVQWMTAGRGIIHSEMPQQQDGLMRGFQLWLNLPATHKMTAPAYVDLAPEQLRHLQLPGGGTAVLIAGELQLSDGESYAGPIQTQSTLPLYVDIQLQAGEQLSLNLPETHQALLYPFEGELRYQEHLIKSHQAGILGTGDRLHLTAQSPVRLLLLAAKPLCEPVVQYGPFVMNSVAEIEQAIQDYRTGRLTAQVAGKIELSPLR